MKRLFICLLWFASIAGCSEDSKESTMLAEKFEQRRAVCVGRHLIDLPESFVQAKGLTASFIPKRMNERDVEVEIEVQLIDDGTSATEFARRVNARELQIKADAWGQTNILKEARRLSDNAKIFHIQEIDEAYSTELHFWIDGVYVVLKAASYHNRFAAAENLIVNFSTLLKKSYAPDAASKDFCMGSIQVAGEFEKENAGLLFRSDRFSEVEIAFDYSTYAANPTENLLQRVDGPTSLLRKFDADNKVIRKRELTVASMQAQEWLSWIVLGDADQRTRNYGFALETFKRQPSRTQPLIHLELDAKFAFDGKGAPPSLTEAELVGLWDATTRSIRLRPGM